MNSKILGKASLLSLLVVSLFLSAAFYDKAEAFVPLVGGKNKSDGGFGGVIAGVQFCECPIPGAAIKVRGPSVGLLDAGGDIMVIPGKFKVEGGGQFLRAGPFVLGTVSSSKLGCGTFDKDGCKISGGGQVLKTISSFMPI